VNNRFEALLSARTRWLLARLQVTDPQAYAAVIACIARLERDPYPAEVDLTTLVIPGERPYRRAYRCGRWAIAYQVEDYAFVIIQVMVGAGRPPIHRFVSVRLPNRPKRPRV
jgi:hypothetical protein